MADSSQVGSAEAGDEKPAVVEVVVDLLLSLLAHSSHSAAFRDVAKTVLRRFAADLTEGALELFLNVLTTPIGADDDEYRAGQQAMYKAAEAAGMDVRYSEIPGGHSFAVWSEGLKQQLPWLMQRVGLIS